MQAVSADNDVETSRNRVLESDLAIPGDGGNGVGKDVLDVVYRSVIEHLAEIVAHDLDVVVRDGREHLVQVDRHRGLAATADHDELRWCPSACRGWGPAGPFFPLPAWPGGKVDRVAARLAGRGRPLHHGDVETVPVEPIGQHGPGDACAGDQDPHRGTSSLTRLIRK